MLKMSCLSTPEANALRTGRHPQYPIRQISYSQFPTPKFPTPQLELQNALGESRPQSRNPTPSVSLAKGKVSPSQIASVTCLVLEGVSIVIMSKRPTDHLEPAAKKRGNDRQLTKDDESEDEEVYRALGSLCFISMQLFSVWNSASHCNSFLPCSCNI